MRVRIIFSKTAAMRFTSHLDLHRTLERTMRRADLPLAYSEGFTPRPKLQLASALPLGFTSEAEAADFWLKKEIPVDKLESAFVAAQPPGIQLHSAEELPLDAPKLQVALRSAVYLVSLPAPEPALDQRVAELLESGSVIIEKTKKGKKKSVDIRPLIQGIRLSTPETGQPVLHMTLKAEEGATGRPDDVLTVLGLDPLGAKIHRKELIFA
jgi:radical SAM-linked protein